MAADAEAKQAQVHHQDGADQKRQSDQVNDFERRDQRGRVADGFAQIGMLQPLERSGSSAPLSEIVTGRVSDGASRRNDRDPEHQRQQAGQRAREPARRKPGSQFATSR